MQLDKSAKKGFTLIELLVVIAIISILSAIGMTQLASAREKARDAARRLDMSQYQHHLTSYYDDHNQIFPLVSGDKTGVAVVADSSQTKTTTATGVFAIGGEMIPNYLAQSIIDPLEGRNDHGYYYIANCNNADCALATGATDYLVYSKMEIGDYMYALGPSGRVTDVADQLSTAPTCPGTASGDPTLACTPPS